MSLKWLRIGRYLVGRCLCSRFCALSCVIYIYAGAPSCGSERAGNAHARHPTAHMSDDLGLLAREVFAQGMFGDYVIFRILK